MEENEFKEKIEEIIKEGKRENAGKIKDFRV